MIKYENLATGNGTCNSRLPVLIARRPFVMSQNRENAGLPAVQSQTDLNVFSQIRVIGGKSSGQLFITSSSSHIFNKTD